METREKAFKDWLLTIVLLLVATSLAFLFFYIVPEHSANITLLYILALLIIARYTDRYRYGIAASFVSVVCVNYLFTYPYFELNFTLTGYPVTFVEMLGVTTFACTMTTQMKHQAKELAERERQLMEVDKEKMRANLLRAVTHDLRTPLTSIIGTVNNLIDNDSMLTKQEQLTMQQQIYDDSIWLLNMCDNLLSVTRIQSGETKLKTTLEPVEEVVSEAVTRLRKRIPEASINVKVPEEFVMIPMDAILIEQVIINLLENAIVHSHSEQPIELVVTQEEDEIVFRIIDYGIGIDEDRIQKLFDGIPQAGAQVVDGRRGMGIGLSICKTIIVAHGGSICAKNRENGADFIFKLGKSCDSY